MPDVDEEYEKSFRFVALRLYQRIADKNGGGDWQGEAFTLEPQKFGGA